jgi:peptidoglycan/LPS O-acetylase OafA/YrhL
VPHLSFKRDFLLNQHWTPRGLTLLWIAGSVLALLAASYWLVEARRYAPAWLMILGQTAFVLYVVHQVIAYTVVKRLLGVSFTSWSRYGAATAALMIGLVYLGYGWAALRRRLRRAPPRPPDDQPSGATSTIASNSA